MSVKVPPVSIPIVRSQDVPSVARRCLRPGVRLVAEARGGRASRPTPGAPASRRPPPRDRGAPWPLRSAHAVRRPRDLLGPEPREAPERREHFADIADDGAEQAFPLARATRWWKSQSARWNADRRRPARPRSAFSRASALIVPARRSELAHLARARPLGHEARRSRLDEHAELVEIAQQGTSPAFAAQSLLDDRAQDVPFVLRRAPRFACRAARGRDRASRACARSRARRCG